MNNQDIREKFASLRQSGMRARDAAQHLNLSEGAVLAAHLGTHSAPLKTELLKPQWLSILQTLEACGPVMALTRNEACVHEKTGVYQQLSATGPTGLALGEDIDLRLFFNHWHAGFAVHESANSSGATASTTSLQFFDRFGNAVHKVFPREATHSDPWRALLTQATDDQQALPYFDNPVSPTPTEDAPSIDAQGFAQAWSEMTDTHQFFGLLRKFGVQRQQAFRLVEGRYAQPVPLAAVRRLLQLAAASQTPIMCFVGSTGCIQIHSGPIHRVVPMETGEKTWLNVLDPKFNLHLREDLITHVWKVEKPSADGTITSLEAFDAQGELVTMFFGARKPGQTERLEWRQLLAQLSHSHAIPA